MADALLDLYGQHEIAASILLRGMTGFGLTHHLRTDRSLTLSEDLPLMAIAVDSRPRIEAVLGRTLELNSPGPGHPGTGPAAGGGRPAGWAHPGLERARPDGRHEATKLTVYLGRQERIYRVPAFAAVCDLLHRRGIAGATALLGVDGTAHGRRERARFFSRNAEVPMMVVAVGSGERIGQVLPELGALLRRPLLTLERVRVCKRDGQLLAAPDGLPGVDPSGMALWQKLTVYTSESAQHHGQPVHRAIVGRLRAAGLSGATSLRGIWGFHGDHPPHGDRLLQLGRHAPAVTIVIDTPERISRGIRHHRRADDRARPGDQRDHPGHARGRRRPPARRPEAGHPPPALNPARSADQDDLARRDAGPAMAPGGRRGRLAGAACRVTHPGRAGRRRARAGTPGGPR